MKVRTGIISAITGASLLSGVGIASLVASSGSAPGAAVSATLMAAPAAATAPANTTPACSSLQDDGGWPPVVQGRPAGLDAGDAPGVYTWHDDEGWHLRITHQNDNHQVYTGVLSTAGTFSDVDAVKLERNDTFKVGPEDHVIAFKFNNYGGIDGLDFRTHCAEGIHFELRADGAPLNPTEVYLGHGDQNPPTVPFTIRRQG